MLCCYGLSSFDPGISLLMHNILIEGHLWAEPSTGYRGRPQDRIPRPALSPASCHEGVPALHTATVYAPLKQGTWPYCPQALTPLHLWAPHGPGAGRGGCPEQALAGIPGHRSERHMACSGSEASQSCAEPRPEACPQSRVSPTDAEVLTKVSDPN